MAGSVPVGPVSGSFSGISLADVWTLITGKRDVVDRPKLDWTECSGKSVESNWFFFWEEYLHLVSLLSFLIIVSTFLWNKVDIESKL